MRIITCLWRCYWCTRWLLRLRQEYTHST